MIPDVMRDGLILDKNLSVLCMFINPNLNKLGDGFASVSSF